MKRTMAVLFGTALLTGWAIPAFAHVSAEDPSVPMDSETRITFSVPVEEDGHTHGMRAMHAGEDHGTPQKAGEGEEEDSAVYNREVEIEVPRGFEVISCDRTPEWNCEAEPHEGSPSSGQAHGGTITFTRATSSGSKMDHLSFTVHTPAHKGSFPFPTSQTLSDGDETDWQGDGVTSEHPAPRIQVVDRDVEAKDHCDSADCHDD